MATQVELLAQLQRVDQSLKSNLDAIETHRQRLAELDGQLAARRTQLAAVEAEVAAFERRQRELEAQLTDAESKMKDRRMRIARIRNDKELALVRREIDALKEVTGTVETELLVLMEQLEARRGVLDGERQEVARLETERAGSERELAETIARSEGAIADDRTRRAALLESVDGDLHRRYELIFARRGGVAVVGVRAGTCQGCHMNVPPQLFNQIQRNEQVFLCPSCQRILFWDQQIDEESKV